MTKVEAQIRTLIRRRFLSCGMKECETCKDNKDGKCNLKELRDCRFYAKRLEVTDTTFNALNCFVDGLQQVDKIPLAEQRVVVLTVVSEWLLGFAEYIAKSNHVKDSDWLHKSLNEIISIFSDMIGETLGIDIIQYPDLKENQNE